MTQQTPTIDSVIRRGRKPMNPDHRHAVFHASVPRPTYNILKMWLNEVLREDPYAHPGTLLKLMVNRLVTTTTFPHIKSKVPSAESTRPLGTPSLPKAKQKALGGKRQRKQK